MKNHFLLWVIVITIALVSLVSVISLTLQYREVEKERAALQRRLAELMAENERLEHDINLDVTDEYIIAMMRKMGYYFPGEKIFTYHDSEETTEE